MRLLSLDLESYPNQVYTYATRNVFVGVHHIEQDARMLCFSYQWVDLNDPAKDGPIKFVSNWSKAGQLGMVTKARDLINQADMVMGWHSRGFDVKMIRGECMLEDIAKPRKVLDADLYAMASDVRFVSKKLEYCAQRFLGVGKLEHEGMIELAVKAHYHRDPDARQRLRQYNMTDVERTTGLYHHWQSRGYIEMPNVNAFLPSTGEHACPGCGGDDLKRDGYRYTKDGNAYQLFRCRSCNRYSTGKRRVSGEALK